jgi:hypothetical protein
MRIARVERERSHRRGSQPEPTLAARQEPEDEDGRDGRRRVFLAEEGGEEESSDSRQDRTTSVPSPVGEDESSEPEQAGHRLRAGDDLGDRGADPDVDEEQKRGPEGERHGAREPVAQEVGRGTA